MNRNEQLFRLAASGVPDVQTAQKYAAHLEELFDTVVPEKIGKTFCEALDKNDYAAAVHVLAAYYREKPDFSVAELSGRGPYDHEYAEKCLKGIVRVINIEWAFPNGEVDFLFDPTAVHGPRNNEWLWQYNRHAEWKNFARAYTATGDERYAVAFVKQLLKWIAQTEIPANWNGPGSAWRTIECGIRLLGSWQIAFDGFHRSPSVSDIALLLMIASMHRQSVHLVKHPTARNWLMMEANGIYTFSALFPELRDARSSRKIAAEHLLRELDGQLLPDGMHCELSPDYQGVVFNCVCNFYNLAKNLGMLNEIPEDFAALVHKTVKAAVLLSTPALTQPCTNDTYTVKTNLFTERAANLFGDDPVYRFINTARAEGTPPSGETASAFLPYAGFAVMRSDWSADAAYLCFDVGPLGAAHVHQDMLNIILFKGKDELLYDDGGGQYEISDMRRYAISSYAHNVALVDGLSQARSAPAVSDEPIQAHWLSNDTFDYATATYSDDYGAEGNRPATHKREVRFFKPDFFCVVDTFTSLDGEVHDYELLFHLDTEHVLPLDGYKNALISDFGGEYELALIPLDEKEGALKITVGTNDPVQGWYVGRNDRAVHEAACISRAVKNARNAKLATLLIPLKKDAPYPVVTRTADGTATVLLNGKSYTVDVNALA